MKQLFQIRRSKLAQNTAWMLSGQILTVGLQGVYFILLARLLGSSEYGVLVGATAFVTAFSSFSSLGSGMLLVRYVSSDGRSFPAYWGNAILSTMLSGSLIVAIAAFAGPHLLHTKAQGLLIMIAAGECLCAALSTCAGQAFQAIERLQVTAFLNSLTSCLRLVAVAALWIFWRHANATMWGAASLLVSAAAVVAAVTMVSVRIGRPRFHLSLFRQRLAEGLGFSCAYSTTSVYNDVDKAMLTRYGAYAESGQYGVAYRFIDFACIPVRSLHAAAMPRFFREGSDAIHSGAAFARRVLKRTLPYSLLAAIALFAGAPLIPMLLGKGFSISVPALRWLCLIPAMRALHFSAGDAITGSGNQRWRTGAQFGAAAFNFGINLIFIPKWSWLGAAWSSLLTDSLLAAANWTILCMLLRNSSARALTAARRAA